MQCTLQDVKRCCLEKFTKQTHYNRNKIAISTTASFQIFLIHNFLYSGPSMFNIFRYCVNIHYGDLALKIYSFL